MLGMKSFDLIKNLIVVFLLLALVMSLVFSTKCSIYSRQAMHNIFRFLAIKESTIKTSNFIEMETENYKIRYMSVDDKYIPIVAEVAEEAYNQVSEFFDRETLKKTTLVVYPDTTSLAQSFGWDRDEKAMGVYWGGTIRILSPRAWINDEQVMLQRFSSEGPIVHEFAHLIVDDITRGNYNRWWTEGIAQYVEKNIIGFAFADPFDGREVLIYSFADMEKHFDELDQARAYWQSLKAVEYIVNTFGEVKIFDILESLSEGMSMQKAIQVNLNMSMLDFEQGFSQYVQEEKQSMYLN